MVQQQFLLAPHPPPSHTHKVLPQSTIFLNFFKTLPFWRLDWPVTGHDHKDQRKTIGYPVCELKSGSAVSERALRRNSSQERIISRNLEDNLYKYSISTEFGRNPKFCKGLAPLDWPIEGLQCQWWCHCTVQSWTSQLQQLWMFTHTNTKNTQTKT